MTGSERRCTMEYLKGECSRLVSIHSLTILRKAAKICLRRWCIRGTGAGWYASSWPEALQRFVALFSVPYASRDILHRTVSTLSRSLSHTSQPWLRTRKPSLSFSPPWMLLSMSRSLPCHMLTDLSSVIQNSLQNPSCLLSSKMRNRYKPAPQVGGRCCTF